MYIYILIYICFKFFFGGVLPWSGSERLAKNSCDGPLVMVGVEAPMQRAEPLSRLRDKTT